MLGANIQGCRLQTTRHLTGTTKTETYKYRNKNNTRHRTNKGQHNRHYKNNRNTKQTHTTTTKNSMPIQAHTAQHTTGNIHTPKQNMATYYTNFMTTTFNRLHILRPRGPLLPTTTRPNFLYRPNTPTFPTIPINPLLQQTRYPLTPTATTTRPNFSPRTNITHPLLSNHIQQQIHNFIQPRHILGYLQDKQRTNNNRK